MTKKRGELTFPAFFSNFSQVRTVHPIGNVFLEEMMKKIGVIVFVACIVIGLSFANFFSVGRFTNRLFHVDVDFSEKGAHGSGNVATEKRDLGGFRAVEVSGAFKVEIVWGKDFSVEVQADDNIVPLIDTHVSSDTLYIELEKGVSTKNDMIVRVTAPNIDRVESSGASKVNLSDIKTDSLSIQASGASKIVASGETAKLDIEISGASGVDAEQLRASNVSVDASGASKATVNATSELQADASGASKILYTGEPATVNKDESGGSRITKK